jgi:hypothetical protein
MASRWSGIKRKAALAVELQTARYEAANVKSSHAARPRPGRLA